jgi:rod shape-determining protein MreC
LSRYSTFDSAPPPLFRQGASALSRLLFFCSLALFLMVADVRFGVIKPLRSVVATVLYPAQWLIMQPLHALRGVGDYFQTLQAAQSDRLDVHQKLLLSMQKSAASEQLQLENQRLRLILALRDRPQTSGIAAEVIYDAADPYTRKIVINKGTVQDIIIGSPVLDELGVVGQVTRVHALTSEVTLLIDRDQAIPVLNSRTGARSVAFGDALAEGGTLDLRFMAANADILAGDLLTTSGVDGVYPAGLPVAIISKIERRADTAFAKIHCTPIAKMTGTLHVMVVKPLTVFQPNTLLERPALDTGRKKASKP